MRHEASILERDRGGNHSFKGGWQTHTDWTQGGSEPQRATGPRGLGDPASRQAAGKSAWHGGWEGAPAALCPCRWLKEDGSAKSTSLLVSGEESVFLGST